MKTLLTLAALGLTLLAPGALQARLTRTVEKVFAVQPNGTFKATTEGGDITINTADVNEVRITATQFFRTDSDAEADEILKKLALDFTQNGNDVTAEAKYEKPSSGFRVGMWPPVKVSFTVTVPKFFNVNLTTSGGDIEVASLNGNAKLKTSGGDLRLDRIAGEVDGHTSGGDITLKEGTARAKLRTSGGDIKVSRAGGPTEVSTSGGDVHIDSVAQLISATTSGGDVTATITEPLKNDATLSTSGGEVKVTVLKSAAFDLDASTSGGDVEAEGLTITIEKGGIGKRQLIGKVNGGGPKLKLRSSGGDVQIRTK
ncbi:DUF4097 family beta strand repeat-containing protein [Oleiharenicola lentus]|uniref:DUF4097 family beta strand repeat-containing protein n=1 Tax=Oleiharenicola lentus TaxID=2508720 RepID=UPI003F6657D6